MVVSCSRFVNEMGEGLARLSRFRSENRTRRQFMLLEDDPRRDLFGARTEKRDAQICVGRLASRRPSEASLSTRLEGLGRT